MQQKYPSKIKQNKDVQTKSTETHPQQMTSDKNKGLQKRMKGTRNAKYVGKKKKKNLFHVLLNLFRIHWLFNAESITLRLIMQTYIKCMTTIAQ